MSGAKAKVSRETDQVVVFPSTVATLPGVTARPTLADQATAERLVASRAFTYDAPEIPEGGEKPELEVTPFDEAERAALDLWVSPVPHGQHYKNPPPEAAAAAAEPVDDDVDVDQPADGADAPATSQ